MIVGFAALTLLLASDAGVAAVLPTEGAQVLISDAQSRLLSGDPLPPDLDLRLSRLEPAERLRVLVFLRRSGLLTGPGWTADRLLAPAKAEEAVR